MDVSKSRIDASLHLRPGPLGAAGGPQAGAYSDQVRGDASPANRPNRPTRARRIVPFRAAGG